MFVMACLTNMFEPALKCFWEARKRQAGSCHGSTSSSRKAGKLTPLLTGRKHVCWRHDFKVMSKTCKGLAGKVGVCRTSPHYRDIVCLSGVFSSRSILLQRERPCPKEGAKNVRRSVSCRGEVAQQAAAHAPGCCFCF